MTSSWLNGCFAFTERRKHERTSLPTSLFLKTNLMYPGTRPMKKLAHPKKDLKEAHTRWYILWGMTGS